MKRTIGISAVFIILAVVVGCGGSSPTPSITPAVVYSVDFKTAFVGHSEVMFFVSTSQPDSTSRVLVIKDLTGTIVTEVRVMPLAFGKFGSVSVNGLKSATDYLAVMYVLWGANDDIAYDYAIFTTKAAPQPPVVVDPPMFKTEPTVTDNGLTNDLMTEVVFNYSFTKSARIYIEYKPNITDPLWSHLFTSIGTIGGNSTFRFSRTGPGTFMFVLSVLDDNGKVTDSRVLTVSHK